MRSIQKRVRMRFLRTVGNVLARKATCFLVMSFLVVGGLCQAQADDDRPPAEPPEPAPRPAATPAQAQAPVEQGPAVTPTPTPTPLVFENIPVKTLWDQYQDAISKIDAGDPAGIDAFLRVVSSEDEKWLQAHFTHLADLLSSSTLSSSSPQERKLFVLQALARNMPHGVSGQPKLYRQVGSANAIAKVVDSSGGKPVEYLTPLLQENGRWVLYHPFFVRDFVWVPQLAVYKSARKLPLAPEEAVFLKQGFAPFVEWARGLLQYCGYLPGGDNRGTAGSAQ